jgi:hypothetical protein
MHRYLSGFLDPFVSLVEIQQLMYFLHEADEPLNLHYTKAPDSPYSKNLRDVLKTIEGNFIGGYGDGGDDPSKPLEILAGIQQQAIEFLADNPDTEARIKRVCALISGFESPFGLELLATVYWLHTRERPSCLDDLVQQTYAWNPRKRQFSPRQIQLASHVLIRQGWVEPLA